MTRAETIAAAIQDAFPGVRVTETSRTQAQQDDYVRRGQTKSRNSQHLSGNGIDIVLPKSVKPSQIRTFLSSKGIEPGEFINESGRGSNQGTGAHLHIGLASKGGGPVSTYDRVTAAKQDAGPSLQKVYEAYKAGRMSPQETAQYEHDVLNGAVMLPRGAAINKKPAVPTLPSGVIQAYNGRTMSDEDRAAVDQDLQDGVFALPRGAKLQAPAARTMGETFGMGVRNVMEGAGGLLDYVAGPANTVVNAVTGGNLSTSPVRDLARSGADAMGLAVPETSSEQLNAALIEGGAQGLLTAGAALPLAGASGATGAVARTLSSAPIIDTVSGATSGGSAEVARQAGAGPVGQLLAGVAGGGLTAAGMASAGERIAARAGRNVGKDISEVVTAPKSTVIDEAGNLTDDGIEIATQNGLTPDELKAHYGEAPPNVQRGVANDVPTEESIARAVGDDLPIEEIAPSPPIRATPEEPRATPERTVSEPTPEAFPETALARVQEGKDVGVDYSRGQATKSFDTQDAEARLKNSNGPEAEQARQFVATQQAQVKSAVEDLKTVFGDPTQNATDRGVAVKEAVRELRDQGKAGVTALYKTAAELGGDELGLIADDIKRAATDVQIDESVAPAVKAELDRQLARYGLAGKAEKMNELGITKSTMDDGSVVSFRGEVEPLTVANAEDLRQSLNRLYSQDQTNALAPVKRAIDDSVEEALESATARGEQAGPVGAAYRRAREAHQEQKTTFSNKDVIEQISAFKKGSRETEAVDPAQVFNKIFAGGKEGLTNLKKVKSVLLSNPTPNSTAAWKAIQAHGIATIFDKAVTRTTNAAGDITDAVSGAKLRSSLEAFGTDKLKVLLDTDNFNRVMKLRRVIEDVTVPVSGTTNPSGSGNLIMRLLKDVDNQVTAAFAAAGTVLAGPAGGAAAGTVGRMVSPAIKNAREAAQARQTAKGLTDYTPEAAAIDDAPKPPTAGGKAKGAASSSVKAFIDTYGSPRILTPVLVSASGDEE